MPEKSVREMSWRERRMYSLEARTFWGSVIGSVIVGLVAFLIGLGLFAYALVGQYTGEAFGLCRSTAMVVENIVDVEDLTGDVMQIYKGLYREELEKTRTEEYQAHFAEIEEREDYQYLKEVLGEFLKTSDVNDLYVATYDASTSSLVMIADPDESEESGFLPGDREPASKKEREKFMNWDGEGKLYSIVKNPLHGRMCTAGMPLYGKDGKPVAFVMSDVTLNNVARGMKTFTFLYTLLLAAVMFIYSVLITKHTKKTVIDPINQIAQACQDYRDDKKAGRDIKDRFSMLNIRTGDEIENLALTMADMEKDVADYVENLTKVTAEKERVSTELNMAGEIQASMLPHIFPPYPDRKEFDLYASMEPAKETGGDFYDYFLIDDDHLCKYVLLTSLDENDELNIWKFYNVIRIVEETFRILKSDLDIRPVFHKTDDGIKAHLNLAVLAYWIVSVTKYRLKIREYPNVRWEEIMRIAQAQVVVTAEMETEDGKKVSVRQSTEAEAELAKIYRLLEVCPNPIGKIKSVVPLKPPQKNPPPEKQGVT